MYKVIKRDGSVAEFDIAKISGAIAKAFGALNKPCDPNDIDFIALKVTADFEDKIKDDLISVEAIQDSAEQVLIQSGHSDVAKAYILYRREREKLRNLKSTILDYKETVNNYVHEKNLRMRENATASYSVSATCVNKKTVVFGFQKKTGIITVGNHRTSCAEHNNFFVHTAPRKYRQIQEKMYLPVNFIVILFFRFCNLHHNGTFHSFSEKLTAVFVNTCD